MLTQLSIRNIVLIEQLDLDFSPGLCVLTGETGAGKSIILDALGCVLGQRISQRLLRHDAPQGSVTAIFEKNAAFPLLTPLLRELAIPEEDTLVLRRVISKDGKSRAFVNDTPVNITTLKQIGDALVEIHGQQEQGALLQAHTHRAILDAYASHTTLLGRTSDAFHHYKELEKQLTLLQEAKTKASAERDYLHFICRELSELNPKPGEETALAEKRTLLQHREKFMGAMHTAIAALEEGTPVEDRVRTAQNALMRHTATYTHFETVVDTLERAAIEITEAASLLNEMVHQYGDEKEDIEAIESRLFALRDTARKYQQVVDMLPAFLEETKKQLVLAESSEERLGTLESDTAQAKEHYIAAAKALTESRIKAAEKLKKALIKELAPLKMDKTQFSVAVEASPPAAWNAEGTDNIMFLASTNPGTPLAPLHTIASGGELSRFMLALKCVLQHSAGTPVLIFDEIDTGVGGAVADAIGKRLLRLAQHAQVFTVTHQPQVAAYGQSHYKVAKSHKNQHTHTHVALLTPSERHEELARMLAGETVTEEARAAARKLLSTEAA